MESIHEFEVLETPGGRCYVKKPNPSPAVYVVVSGEDLTPHWGDDGTPILSKLKPIKAGDYIVAIEDGAVRPLNGEELEILKKS